MTNAAATIALTFGGTDIQQQPPGIFLQLVRGLSEPPSVRGTDTIVPSRAGRIARNRVRDVLRIELVGVVAGWAPNEIQAVTITGAPTGGTFTLTYSGQTTAGVAFDANAATVQAALEALSNIAPGDVAVSGGPLPAVPLRMEFTGTLASTNVAQMTGSAAGLTGGTPVLTITTTLAGGSTSTSDLAHFRTLAKTVRALFDPAAAPASLVATLEDGTTATIAARTLNTVWDQVTPSLARVSIELEAAADWSVV